jgi:hypothetical protein
MTKFAVKTHYKFERHRELRSPYFFCRVTLFQSLANVKHTIFSAELVNIQMVTR